MDDDSSDDEFRQYPQPQTMPQMQPQTMPQMMPTYPMVPQTQSFQYQQPQSFQYQQPMTNMQSFSGPIQTIMPQSPGYY